MAALEVIALNKTVPQLMAPQVGDTYSFPRVAEFLAGAVGAPSITFTGDPNTGLWSPAADTVAVSTGGSERVRVAPGNDGVIVGAGNAQYVAANRGALTINGTTDAVLGFGVGGVASGYFFAATAGVTIGSPPTKSIFFNINGDRMTLDAAGNLGLGVTPSTWGGANKALEQPGGALLSASSSGIYLASNAYFDGTNWIYKASNNAAYYGMVLGQHRWYTAGTSAGTAGGTVPFVQAMTLDASGNLALGAASASYRLDITAAASTNGVIAVRAATNQNSSLSLAGHARTPLSGSFDLIQDQNQAYVYQRANQPLVFGTNNIERARFDASGNFITNVNAAAPALGTNSTMSFELTSNTSLKIVVRGTDGTTRSASLTLA